MRKPIRLALGSSASTLAGAVLGLMIPGDGNPAHIGLICLMALLGWFVWIRRGRPILDTLAMCFGALVIYYPVGLILREISRP